MKFLELALADTFNKEEFEGRQALAKELAQRIYSNNIDTEEELVLSLHWILSSYYKIPLFSDYFKGRSLDQLILECELIRLMSTNSEQQTSDLLNNNKEEAESLFDDWETVPADESWKEDAERFMNTNNFKE